MIDEDRLTKLSAVVADQQARIQRLEDEREISQLLSLYGFLVDLPGDQPWVNLFTDDGSVDMSFGHGAYAGVGEVQGHEALLEFIKDDGGVGRKRPGNFLRIMHMQGNNEAIHIDGDEAVANSYSWVLRREPDGGLKITTGGVNQWHFRRVDGRWLIVSRTRREVGDPLNAEILAPTVVDAHPRPVHASQLGMRDGVTVDEPGEDRADVRIIRDE